MEKMTKKEMFEMIKVALADQATVVDFCDKEIAALDRKAAKAKERAAEKKAEGDELTAVIESVLTDELATIADITAQIEGPDVTVHKVSYRLGQLAKNGKAVKEEVSVGGGDGAKARRVVAYKRA
jgi:hypothetical protein